MESGERAYYEKRAPWIIPPPNRQNAFQPKGIFLFLNMKKILIAMNKIILIIILFWISIFAQFFSLYKEL